MITINIDQGPTARAVLSYRPSTDSTTPHGLLAQRAAQFINDVLDGKAREIVEPGRDEAPPSRAARLVQIQAELDRLGVEVKLPISAAIIEKLHEKAPEKPVPAPAVPKPLADPFSAPPAELPPSQTPAADAESQEPVAQSGEGEEGKNGKEVAGGAQGTEGAGSGEGTVSEGAGSGEGTVSEGE